MKNKILKTIISMLLILSFAVSFSACGDEPEEFTGDYYNYGLHYHLPEEYQQLTVPYSEFCYYDGNAYFYFHAYSPEELEDEEIFDGCDSLTEISYGGSREAWESICHGRALTATRSDATPFTPKVIFLDLKNEV